MFKYLRLIKDVLLTYAASKGLDKPSKWLNIISYIILGLVLLKDLIEICKESSLF